MLDYRAQQPGGDLRCRGGDEQKEQATGDAKKALAIGCSAAEIGATFVNTDSSGVARAQQELSDARNENRFWKRRRPAAHELELLMNDRPSYYGDNTGELSVNVVAPIDLRG